MDLESHSTTHDRRRSVKRAHAVSATAGVLVGCVRSFSSFCDLSSFGSTIQHLYQNVFENFAFPIPTVQEQSAIANFLDRETAKIDALVEQQQLLIKLLKEKRQAVISRAVTKGLDPNAPMKDSGVEWLGEVPEHWGVVKLANVATAVGDGLHGTPEYVDESECYFINGNNLVDGCIEITSSTRCVSAKVASTYAVPLTDRSVLVSINGTIGNLALYRGESVTLGKSAAYINCSDRLDRAFLLALLSSTPTKSYFKLAVTGTTISNLSLEAVRNMKLPLPPLADQMAIIQALQSAIFPLDSLIAESAKALALFQERRSALISAAVTGKIDVRELVEADAPLLDVVAA